MKPDDDDRDDLDLERPLGLADEPIRQTPEDLPQGDHADRRRHTRALGEDDIDRHSTGLGDLDNDPDGGEERDINPS
jgi:hypothetical protein